MDRHADKVFHTASNLILQKTNPGSLKLGKTCLKCRQGSFYLWDV